MVMKGIVIMTAILFLSQQFVFSQAEFTQTIRGTVVDEVTGYPLIGANVLLPNFSPPRGTITDGNGNFEILDVPVGRQSLEVRYLGYHPRSIDNLLLVSGKELVIQVKLEENALELEEVVVKSSKDKDKAQNEMAMISSRTFSVEETERFAGSLGDPARMVANYAGVITQNDSRNDIIIRGNSPVGVLWRIEGVEVPNPNHFGALGTTGGPVSMINNNLLTNSDFLTGAFPAEFGNATAGAFDLSLRSGNNQVSEFVGQVGLNGFEAGAEGPLFKTGRGVKASYVINFRYSTLEVMNKLGISFGTGSAIPQYKDLTYLIDIPGTKAGRFKVFGLWGDGYIELGRDVEDTTANQYNTRGTATNFGSNLWVTGLSHTYYFTEKVRVKSTFSYQTTGSSIEFDSIREPDRAVIPHLRSWQDEQKVSFSVQIKHKINAKNNYSFGLIVDRFDVDYTDSIYDKNYGKFITSLDNKGNFILTRGYMQWQHKFSNQITSYSGLHVQHFPFNSETVIEPRLGLKWQFAAKQSVNFGFGMHSQLQPKIVYFIETYDSTSNTYFRTNEDVKFTRSNHYIAGYDYLPAPDFRIKLEAYYQQLYNVPIAQGFPEFSMINAGDFFTIPRVDSLLNEGSGSNKGIEITIEKFLGKGYYFLVTTSLFDSKYKAYDEIERSTAFNGNYVINTLAGYEKSLSKKIMLTFDMKFVWAGGRRYVPVDITKSVSAGEEERDWDQAFEDKYNDYIRVDIRLGLKRNGKRINEEFGIDLQNVTGYKSIFLESFDPREGETYKVYQQGFMPMMLYRIRF